jgi:hypothetical protein
MPVDVLCMLVIEAVAAQEAAAHHNDLLEAVSKLAFVAKSRRFMAKNRGSDDVYTQYKRRSCRDFAAETARLQQKWSFETASII